MNDERPDINDWLEVSGLLLRELLPPGGALVYFGQNMEPDAFAALVERERHRVDHALTSMASATDEHEAKAIFGQLNDDTLTALFSRWASYSELWRRQQCQAVPEQWVPPRWSEIWRALFLSMTSEGIHSTAAARQLWPEVFGDPR